MIVGERQRREDEKMRLEQVILDRQKDIEEIKSDKAVYKLEIDARLDRRENERKMFRKE